MSKSRNISMASYIGIDVALGVSVGIVLDNIPVEIAIGVGAGTSIGLSKQPRKVDNEDDPKG